MKSPLASKGIGWRSLLWWTLAAVILVVVAYYVIQWLVVDDQAPVRLVVYAFSIQEEAFTQGIFPAFERAWESQTGQQVSIEGVFGPSGTLVSQISLGAPADVVVLSNARHTALLKFGRLARRDTEPVVIGVTPLVIVTRAGNPAGISGFADLAQPGLTLLHADPRSSGVGEWAVLAEYGSAALESSAALENSAALESYDPQAGEAQLQAIWRNVRLLAPSARAAMSLFELGATQAFITYEQDALLAVARGISLEIVLPERTILAEPVAMIVDDNVSHAERPVAEAFIDFLLSEAGQKILSDYYLRPQAIEYNGFPQLLHSFTVDDLGGWSYAHAELIEKLWQTEIQPRLDLETAPSLLHPGE